MVRSGVGHMTQGLERFISLACGLHGQVFTSGCLIVTHAPNLRREHKGTGGWCAVVLCCLMLVDASSWLSVHFAWCS